MILYILTVPSIFLWSEMSHKIDMVFLYHVVLDCGTAPQSLKYLKDEEIVAIPVSTCQDMKQRPSCFLRCLTMSLRMDG